MGPHDCTLLQHSHGPCILIGRGFFESAGTSYQQHISHHHGPFVYRDDGHICVSTQVVRDDSRMVRATRKHTTWGYLCLRGVDWSRRMDTLCLRSVDSCQRVLSIRVGWCHISIIPRVVQRTSVLRWDAVNTNEYERLVTNL